MTVPEIKAQIVAWIKTGIPNNVKSSNMRTLLNWITLRMDVQEVGRLKITKTTGNTSPELEQGDKVTGIVEDTHIVNAIYLGGNSNLLASYEIDTSSNKVDKGGNEIDTGFSLRESIDSNFQNFDNYIPTSQKGSANGVPETDANNIILTQHLPSYVDDVIDGTYVNTTTFKNLSGTTLTPENGKIYIDTTTNKSYRWSGSVYVLLTGGIVLGETASTAYRGDRGKIAYDHSLLIDGNPHNVTAAQVGLANVDDTRDANKPVSADQLAALNDKVDDSQVLTNVPLNAKFTDTIYTHPTTHPATIINQTSSYRFVTDAEKTTWNAKQAALGFTPDKKRTRKEVNVTTQYTLIAADFTDFYLDFTADGGQTISLILNAGVMPDNGELRAISSGNNKLTYTAGTGTVNFTKPDGATLTTVPYGWSGMVKATAANTYSVNGSLESNVVAQNLVATTATGTALNLSNVVGTNYNYAAFSSATTYTVGSKVINGFARCFINAGTEPTISGGVKAGYSTFTPNKNMEMVVESPDGTAVEFYFIQRV